MPKKFKGENTKAQDARARKAAVREEADEKRKREEEDAAWKDKDKYVARKQDRKAQKEDKRTEQLERKLANQKLLEEEEQTVKAKGGASATKVTRAQIQEAKEREGRELEKQKASGTTAVVGGGGGEEGGEGGGLTEPQQLEQNPNLLELERQRSGEIQARTVDEAIVVLGGGGGKGAGDRHPERRMKAAFAAFEEREMPRLKAENPTLRMSQLRQLLKKEWMKSPDNPLVQGLAHDRHS